MLTPHPLQRSVIILERFSNLNYIRKYLMQNLLTILLAMLICVVKNRSKFKWCSIYFRGLLKFLVFFGVQKSETLNINSDIFHNHQSKCWVIVFSGILNIYFKEHKKVQIKQNLFKRHLPIACVFWGAKIVKTEHKTKNIWRSPKVILSINSIYVLKVFN